MRFAALARRRRDGEPVAYLTGAREFWGLPLKVSPAVLIPRPETETLVELALARLPNDRDLRVLDLGTGSGAIALAIAHERPRAMVLATDVSADALEVARENARRLAIGNVEFVQADWYDGVTSTWRGAAFDLVASNPPYVAAADPHLAEGDVRFEPSLALTPGGDGLGAIERIVAGAQCPACRRRHAGRRARLRSGGGGALAVPGRGFRGGRRCARSGRGSARRRRAQILAGDAASARQHRASPPTAPARA